MSAVSVAEIICISCWDSFDSEAEQSEVVCPHCGFSQAGDVGASEVASVTEDETPVSPVETSASSLPEGTEHSTDNDDLVELDTPDLDAALSDSAEVSGLEPEGEQATNVDSSEDDPFGEESLAGLEGVEIVEEQTLSADAAMETLLPDPEDSPDQPESEDLRWRLKTASGLIFFFPMYQLLERFLSGSEESSASGEVARGTGSFRSLDAFLAVLKQSKDPEVALTQTEADVANMSNGSEGGLNLGGDLDLGKIDLSDLTRDDNFLSALPVSARQTPVGGKDSKKGQSGDTKSKKPWSKTETSSFTFRTERSASPWGGRLFFLLLGLLLGSGAVYYVAWLGLLPGILY
jgi:hypothetical protein